MAGLYKKPHYAPLSLFPPVDTEMSGGHTVAGEANHRDLRGDAGFKPSTRRARHEAKPHNMPRHTRFLLRSEWAQQGAGMAIEHLRTPKANNEAK